jgi:hypothetical protein
LLFGPTRPRDKALVGPGILFTVDSQTTGLSRTGVNQLSQFGTPPILTAVNPRVNPNGAPIVLASQPGQEATGVYRTGLTHSNALYISGVDALHLGPGDQIDGLSLA